MEWITEKLNVGVSRKSRQDLNPWDHEMYNITFHDFNRLLTTFHQQFTSANQKGQGKTK
jgi:hypothetical protein